MKQLTPYDVLVQPRITEKTVYAQNGSNSYTFQVHPKATKQQIKEAVQSLFDVKVLAVRTMNYDGKQRRTRAGIGSTPAWKKAVVRLAEDDSIEGL